MTERSPVEFGLAHVDELECGGCLIDTHDISVSGCPHRDQRERREVDATCGNIHACYCAAVCV